MKKTILAAGIALLLGGLAQDVAAEPKNEVLALINTARNDSTFGYLSYRRSFGSSIDRGLKFRIDVSRGEFDVNTSTGTLTGVRLLLGYTVDLSPSTDLTFYGGITRRELDYDVLLPFLTEYDETAPFVSVEANTDTPNGGEVFGVAEYDGTTDLIYASGFLQYPFGSWKVGGEVSYLEEGDYSRRGLGLRLTTQLTDSIDVTAKLIAAEGGTNGAFDVDSSFFELQVRSKF